MKIFLGYILLALVVISKFTPAQEKDNISLNLIEPLPGRQLELNGKPFYIIGTVSPAGSKLKINGKEIQVDEDGAFLAYSDIILFNDNGVTIGKLLFNISYGGVDKEIDKTYPVKQIVRTTPANKLEFDKSWQTLPSENQTVKIGNNVKVEVKATPNSKVYFNVGGSDENYPMHETSIVNNYIWGDAVFGEGFKGLSDTVKGIYAGSFNVTKELKDSEIKITAVNDALGTITETAPGKISTFNSSIPEIVKTKSYPNLIIGRYGPDLGYKLFLDGGINLEAINQLGSWLECRLSGDETVFIPEADVNIMPEGTPLPDASIYILRTEDSAGFVNVDFGLSGRCPYKIIEHENPQSIEVLVYNVTSNIDWVFYDRKSSFIKQIKWDQPKDNVLKVMVYLNEKTHWGYSANYDGNVLNLKIKKPAKRNSGFLFWSNQLKDRVIVLDPGHNPDTGAIGPRGTRERDMNLQISMQLKEMLEDAGAKVFLTHTTGPLPLRERKERVNSFNPEISISIHNNAVPQGVDPIKHNGCSVYYYYPQSLPLAELIHRNFVKGLGLKDFGLYWDNLYMSRIPESISLLVEPAFMIIPAQEKLLLTYEFREKIARSIFNALKEFYEEYSQ